MVGREWNRGEALEAAAYATKALDKDVSILKRTSNGEPVPLTLRKFREELELQPSMFDALDFGGCGCFVTEEDET